MCCKNCHIKVKNTRKLQYLWQLVAIFLIIATRVTY